MFVGVPMSYLRYFCLLAYSNIQLILCCVFVFVFVALCDLLLPVSLDCPLFLIAPSVFSIGYLA